MNIKDFDLSRLGAVDIKDDGTHSAMCVKDGLSIFTSRHGHNFTCAISSYGDQMYSFDAIVSADGDLSFIKELDRIAALNSVELLATLMTRT